MISYKNFWVIQNYTSKNF